MDAVGIYLDSLNGSSAPLLRDQERTLAARAKTGDEAARARLIKSQLRWVVTLAAKFQGKGIDQPDLVQQGNCALSRAIDSFDPDRGRLSTFTAKVVIRELHSVVKENRRRASRHVPLQNGREESMEWIQVIPDESQGDPGTLSSRGEQRQHLSVAISHLPGRMRRIIKRRLQGQTLRHIASRLDLSYERVRQIEGAAHRMLANMMEPETVEDEE